MLRMLLVLHGSAGVQGAYHIPTRACSMDLYCACVAGLRPVPNLLVAELGCAGVDQRQQRRTECSGVRTLLCPLSSLVLYIAAARVAACDTHRFHLVCTETHSHQAALSYTNSQYTNVTATYHIEDAIATALR